MTASERLIKSTVPLKESGNELAIWCPFCGKTDVLENRLLTFHVNQETGTGQCQVCLKKCDFEELTKILGIQPEPKEIIHNSNPTPSPRIWTLTDILSADFGNEEWLVEDLVPLPSMTAVSGNPGNFKTWMTMAIAQAIAEGKPFLGQFPVRQGAVLIVDEEDHIKHIQKRLKQLSVPKELPIFYLSQEGVRIDNPQSYSSLLKIVKENQISLVIIDSLVRIHNREENDAKQMAFIMDQFRQLIKKGVSVLFTHHHRKQAALGPNNASQSLRGSSDILAAVDCHLTVEKLRSENTLVIRQEKLRTAPAINPFKITIGGHQSESISFIYAGAHDNKKTKTEAAKEAMIQLLEEEPQLFRDDFQEHLTTAGVAGKQAIDTAIKELQNEAAIELVPKEEMPPEARKRHCYRLIHTTSQFPNDIYGRETGKVLNT